MLDRSVPGQLDELCGTLEVARVRRSKSGGDRTAQHLQNDQSGFLARVGVLGQRLDEVRCELAQPYAGAKQLEYELGDVRLDAGNVHRRAEPRAGINPPPRSGGNAQRTRRSMSHETTATTHIAPTSNVAAAASVCSVTAATAQATSPDTSDER